MEKYSHLPIFTQKYLLEDLARAFLSLKTEDEAIKFLVDLLTKEEAIKLAKRIKIAQLILEGREYRAIERALHVSHGTIAKVSFWLKEGGEGFKLALKNLKKRTEPLSKNESFDLALKGWKQFKRRYPVMFWPSLLIEGILDSADKQQKDKMFQTLQKLDKKSKVYQEVREMFHY